MNTRKLRKAIMTLCAALLLVSLSVGITVAYLTAEDSVENTFTVGKVGLELDETDVNQYGDQDSNDRVKANEYKLIPDHSYVKDPTFHLAEGSETSWLFAKVMNELEPIESKAEDYMTIHEQILDNGWVEISHDEATHTRIYYNSVARTPPDSNHVLFEGFRVDAQADLTGYEKKKVTVNGYAVQADGFEDAVDAWNATYGKDAPVQKPEPDNGENGEGTDPEENA